MTELQLHGSHWAEAGLHSLVAAMGPRLLSLGLVAVKGLGLASLHHILSCCSQLATAVFNSCDFDGPEAELELGAAVTEVDTLEELVITSSARCCHLVIEIDNTGVDMYLSHHTRLSYVEWLLRAGPRLKVVHLGSATQVTDDTFGRLVGAGHLAHLEELQVERSPALSLATLDALLGGCPSLRSVGDLANWGGVSGAELGQMRQVCHEQNLALDLSSHQVSASKSCIRRFVITEKAPTRAFSWLKAASIVSYSRPSLMTFAS